MTAKSGHAATAVNRYKRSGFLIHGGRPNWAQEKELYVTVGWEEIKDKDGNTIRWKPIRKKLKTQIPANTSGCIRGTNVCIEKLTKAIRALEDCNAEGKVTVLGQQSEPPS